MRDRRGWWVLLGGFHDLVTAGCHVSGLVRWDEWENLLEKVEGCAEDDPFDTVLVALSQGLPYRLFFQCLASDADPRSSAVGTRRVLLYLSKFDTLGGNIMPSISKVEHAPECSVWVRLGDLEEREIWRVGRWEGQLVYRGNDARIRDGPFEVPGGLASDDARGRVAGVARVRCGCFALVLARRE